MIFEAEAFYLRKVKKKDKEKKIKISTSKEMYETLLKYTEWKDSMEIIESFYVIGLNRSNEIVFIKKVFQGGVAGCYVDIKLIAKLAISYLCSSVILAHNHPSGNKEPSNIDKKLTNKIKDGLELLDISVLDHLILTKNKYYSFLDEGLL